MLGHWQKVANDSAVLIYTWNHAKCPGIDSGVPLENVLSKQLLLVCSVWIGMIFKSVQQQRAMARTQFSTHDYFTNILPVGSVMVLDQQLT